MRYPPEGVRGIASVSRATRFGRVADYAQRAAGELCLLVQIETVPALERLEAIGAVEGVDGLFVGPGDLAASLGHPGASGHPEVVAAVEDAIRRIVRLGKPAGILTGDPVFARRCIALGTTFTAVGIDAGILARATERLAADFRA
jgi:4-hydroxy-2-oxoheptanedioate aldolase